VDFNAFVRAAERGELPPVVLVHGTDAQLLDDALRIATNALLPDRTLATVGRDLLDGDETTGDAIARAAQTLPLMTASRLVAVRRAQEIKDSPGLREYLARPNPTTCLLLLLDDPRDWRERQKRHWLKEAVPAAAVVTLPTRSGGNLVDWLRQRAAAEGLDVSREAAATLVAWVGDDTAALLGEARKAALSGGPGQRTVGEKDVEAVVGEQRIAHMFDLARAIDERRTADALRMLEGLMTSEAPMGLIWQFVAELRITWMVGVLAHDGQPEGRIAGTVHRPIDVVRRKMTAAATSSSRALAAKLQRCYDVERRLKSGGEARAELTALVVELCR
jgi:DNA polymerase III delta subunit